MSFPFIAARHFKPTTGRRIDLIVLHSTESDGTAKAIADYFARTANPVSSHYVAGNDGIWQCVYEKDVAFAAPGANHNGVQLEIVGRAAWGQNGWTKHPTTLHNAALVTAMVCREHNLPVTLLDQRQLLAGERGITTHRAVSLAYRKSDHWDPGYGFPFAEFLRDVSARMQPFEEDDVLRIINPGDGRVYATDGIHCRWLKEVREIDELKAAGAKEAQITLEVFRRLVLVGEKPT